MFGQLFNPHQPNVARRGVGGPRHERLPDEENASRDGNADGDVGAVVDSESDSRTALTMPTSTTEGSPSLLGAVVEEISPGDEADSYPENGDSEGHRLDGGESSDVPMEPNLVVRRLSDDRPGGEFRDPLPSFISDQIEAERELRRRRRCTCTLLVAFFLTKLWIEALFEKDPALILIGAAGTVLAVRWGRACRENDQDLDQRAEEHLRGGSSGVGDETAVRMGNGEGASGDTVADIDPDLGFMSFQAQLALAILESQRQMIENGGYGGSTNAHTGSGVTREAKNQWKMSQWSEGGEVGNHTGGETANDETGDTALMHEINLTRTSSSTTIQPTGSNGSDYGSVRSTHSQDDGDEEIGLEKQKQQSEGKSLAGGAEEPPCSICLCEYEPGDAVVQLPCEHVFHGACLDAWTTDHVRCPLCNLDLMEGFEPDQEQQLGSVRNLNSSARIFLRSNRRSQARYLAFATAAAAIDDSIV